MIIGVGIDMIEVDRVNERIDKDNGFKEKIFSEGEIVFCESKKNKAELFYTFKYTNGKLMPGVIYKF